MDIRKSFSNSEFHSPKQDSKLVISEFHSPYFGIPLPSISEFHSLNQNLSQNRREKIRILGIPLPLKRYYSDQFGIPLPREGFGEKPSIYFGIPLP